MTTDNCSLIIDDCPRLVIAGTASGVGKTTIATGLMAALAARGYRVAPFKVGPDYIDPGYHTVATGRPSRNLDTWLVPPERVAHLFARAAQGADVAVIEGVMGLYDGYDGRDEAGSTAQVAKLLRAPVLLVIDVAGMARSAGATALGYRRFDPGLRLAGVILNNVGSDRHAQWATEAVESAGLPVLGHLRRDAALHLPDRHLGLIPTAEKGPLADFLARVRERLAEGLDVERIVALARTAPPLDAPGGDLFPTPPAAPTVRVAVARDEAFSFYYADNLDLLRAHGAELVPFSPLHDAGLPDGVDGLYLGGGFPEMYAATLSANAPLKAAIRRAAERDLPIYAECGGLMVLTASIEDPDGRVHPTIGLLPGRMVTRGQHTKLGYVTVEARRDSILARRGQILRGHEFHLSDWVDVPPDAPRAYRVRPRHGTDTARLEGYCRGNVLASYVHLHFAADPRLAARFVHACRTAKASNT